MRTFLLLLLVLAPALACSGLLGPPLISRFDVDDGGCGAWSATVEVTNARGQTLQVRQGDEVVGTWPDLWGTQTVTVQGAADPGEGVDLTATLEGATARTVPLTPVPPSFTVVAARPAFQPGDPPRFELRLDGKCRPTGLRYRAATESWDGEGAVGAAVTTIALPPQREGSHALQVELLDGGRSLGMEVTRFAVGDTADLDLDGDGYAGAADCDDTDPTVHPDAAERPDPNGKDDNCDGRVDEGTVAYDDDGDGLSENAGDCNDRDPLVHPNAEERADCRDNDCDGQIDEGRTLGRDDDRYERPGAEPFQFSDSGRRLAAELVFVSRDRQDAESVRFWSDDGDWDDWRIEVGATRVPADSDYDVQIRRVDGGVVATGTIHADGDLVSYGGRSFHDDSGLYEVDVRPTRLYAPYCPLELSLDSR